MDARSGSSTRGHWDGPVICNGCQKLAERKTAWIMMGKGSMWIQCSTMCVGRAPVCFSCPVLIPTSSYGIVEVKQTLGQEGGSVASLTCSCKGQRRCYAPVSGGGVSQHGDARHPCLLQKFGCNSCRLCLRMYFSCYTLFLSPYTGLECRSDPSYTIAITRIILIIAIISKVIMTIMKKTVGN